uniref:Ubiquitin-like domain-containing protein n=4 Tax=Magallana gigas TaxID=29159 RepID=A0A8W8L807_MAGGI
MSEEKKDEIKPESSEHINLKVTGQDGSVVHFKIKKNTPLRKLMSAYCDRAGLKLGVVRFRFDGNPINETDTPSGLDMEDGDSIDVFQQQTGGLLFHRCLHWHQCGTRLQYSRESISGVGVVKTLVSQAYICFYVL